MYKLELKNIKKTYSNGEIIHALNGVSLNFRKSEFVSILGPSGCGKTTLLNIIGGLDHYDEGDLIINGISTKNYTSNEWDTYRNHSIGFVFQSYNLISHQTILQNVEIAMTLSGVKAKERNKRAKEALISVGLKSQMKKKPNQLSGGQMQRVAIARALVNNPDIILADEPTGALDSQTSLQVMEILKEIAKTKLVIMVTHNNELAEEYSSRIIKLLDGSVQSDNNSPTLSEELYDEQHQLSEDKPNEVKNTSMSLSTATSLSFKNLLTKKGRTIITAIAGSIGIISVSLVLALSSGLTSYMDTMQEDLLSGFPISITTEEQSIEKGGDDFFNTTTDDQIKYPNTDVFYRYDKKAGSKDHVNILSDEYLEYIDEIETALPDAVNATSYTSGVEMNVLAKGGKTVVQYDTVVAPMNEMDTMAQNGDSTYWQEIPDNEEFILSLYDLIGEESRMPKNKNEIVLVVDEYNNVDKELLEKLGIPDNNEEFKATDFIGKQFLKVIPNNNFYTKNENGVYSSALPSQYQELYDSEGAEELTITGILRIKEDAGTSYLSTGIAYKKELTEFIINDASNSSIANEQRTSDVDVLSGAPFVNDQIKEHRLITLGVETRPTGINIYPSDFKSKDNIKEYLNDYNNDKAEVDQVIYTDVAEMFTGMIGTMLDAVTYVLIGFAAISLLVSTIMIGIITYVSVIERTKEIGILRSVGARKKDISRVFNAETLIIGCVAGVLGVGMAYLLIIPINSIVLSIAGISGIANLSFLYAILLVGGSMLLTLIAGLIPSRMAAKKDPVIALRSE